MSQQDLERLRHDSQTRAFINLELQKRFAPEDDALQNSITRANAGNLPPMQISPLQGKLLQVLAMSCGARKILEIGTMTGYSSVWLARGLPSDGKLITLEINPKYAEIAHEIFVEAGVEKRVELRVGSALDILPTLVSEAPFDLIFIDADKEHNPTYLQWSLRLSRPGSLIVADNIVRNGRAFQTPPPDASSAGAATYIRDILDHPQLVSVAITNDDAINGIDGFAISVVT